MRHDIRLLVGVLGIIVAAVAGSAPVIAEEGVQKTIGLYMAVVGKTTVAHAGRPPVTVPVKLREDVYFKDVIETQAASRTKALFDDDSLLTVGENSRVEINEYIYEPAVNRRSAVLRLVRGKVRALVGRVLAEAGSKFEVHTPTAVTAARGTYFVVWIEEKSGETSRQSEAVGTGIANIGGSGIVAFTAGGRTVEVPPRTYSFARAGAQPAQPKPLSEDVPTNVSAAIAGTEMPDAPSPESAGEVAAAVGQTTGLLVVEAGEILSSSGLQTLSLPASRLTSSVQTALTPPPVVSGSGLNAVLGTLGISGGLTGGLTGGLPGGLPGGVCVGGICLPPLP